MSRLKGADLGIATPTPTSIGAAKDTAGSGLPSLAGRNPGDIHYDTAAKVAYILTGVVGAVVNDDFNRASLGTTFESGQAVITSGSATPAISNSKLTSGTVGTTTFVGVDLGSGYSSGGGSISADLTRSSNSTLRLIIGSSNGGSNGWRFEIAGTTLNIWDANLTNIHSENPMAAGVADDGATHTWKLEVISNILKVYRDGALYFTAPSAVASPGTQAHMVVAANSTIDNFAAQANGTLAWTPLGTGQLVNTVAASGAAQTLPDVTTATMHNVTLTAACTITLPAAGPGKRILVQVQQDATGGRTLAWTVPAGSSLAWPNGAPPTVSAAANAVDVYEFVAFGAAWRGRVYGQVMS